MAPARIIASPTAISTPTAMPKLVLDTDALPRPHALCSDFGPILEAGQHRHQWVSVNDIGTEVVVSPNVDLLWMGDTVHRFVIKSGGGPRWTRTTYLRVIS